MKLMRKCSFFPSNFVLSKFERTSFERTFKVGLHSKEHYFSTETQFERTTDEFWKNVIRSNNLSSFQLNWTGLHVSILIATDLRDKLFFMKNGLTGFFMNDKKKVMMPSLAYLSDMRICLPVLSLCLTFVKFVFFIW
jgi:hypothetical protein